MPDINRSTLLSLLIGATCNVLVAQNPVDTFSLTPGGVQTFCPGTPLTIPAQTGVTYQWKKNPVWSTTNYPVLSASATATYAKMATDQSNNLYVAFTEPGVTVKMHAPGGTSWTTVGTAGITGNNARHTSIAIDNAGTPWIAFSDNALISSIRNRATVMKYNGSTWDYVGPRGLSASAADYTDITFDATGTPYLAYTDYSVSSKLTIKKWDGANWVTVGTDGISVGSAQPVSLKIDQNGVLYVAVSDAGIGYGLTVYTWNGTSWNTLGSTNITGGSINSPNIKIDKNGIVYVAFTESPNGHKASVVKWNGTAWEFVGARGIGAYAPDYASWVAMDIDGGGMPWIAYENYASVGIKNKATVMRFNGASWVLMGGADFSPGAVSNVQITFDRTGVPFVSGGDDGLGFSRLWVSRFDGSDVGTSSNSYPVTTAGTYMATEYKDGKGTWTFNSAVVTIDAALILATSNTLRPDYTIAGSAINYIDNGSCKLIAGLQRTGASPATGLTAANVWMEAAVPVNGSGIPYVVRHYEIIPSVNAATATGSVTLYFTQNEFTAYNATANHGPDLPVDATDVANNKNNVTIIFAPGSSSNGSGLMNTYTGTRSSIIPTTVTWNSTLNRWEVTFNTTGFGGFFVTTSLAILPLKWLSVSAATNELKQTVINWQVEEENVTGYEIERSTDGSGYANIGTIASKGNGTNRYSYTTGAIEGVSYYRIKQTDIDGRASYSMVLRFNQDQTARISLYPVPTKDRLTVTGATGKKYQLMNLAGNTVQTGTLNRESINIATLPAGIYLLKIDNEILKVIKE
jgi:hypothetical protein